MLKRMELAGSCRVAKAFDNPAFPLFNIPKFQHRINKHEVQLEVDLIYKPDSSIKVTNL